MTSRPQSLAEVESWFRQRMARLWPAGLGSLSLRRSPCLRPHCHACATGEQHPSYVLYGRGKGGRRFAVYIPDSLAPQVRRALANGRALQKLLSEAARRYAQALKQEPRG